VTEAHLPEKATDESGLRSISKGDIIFITASLLLAALITLSVGDKTYDDAYITFRYARNLASGMGFVYNPGENTLGTTTPLLTILLALLGRLTSINAIPLISQWLSGVALFSCSLFAYLLARDDGKPVGGVVAGLLILINPVFIVFWGGEALLLIALVLAAFYFYFRGYEALPAVLLGLAFLTRGEGIIPAFVIYAHFIITRKRFPWRAAVAFSVTLLPWLIYSLVTFGSPLPDTLSVKVAQGRSGLWAPFLITSLEWLAAYTIPTPHFSYVGPNYSYLIIVALAVLGGLSQLFPPVRYRWWAIMIWLGLYTAGYTWLGVPFYHWYAAPLALGGLILAGLGAQLLFDLINQHGKRYETGLLITLAAVLCVPLLTALNHIRQKASEPIPLEYRLYINTALWLRQHTPPTATVGYFEIGYLGYFSERRLIDPAGLVNPGVASQVAQGNFKWSYHRYKPDYIVIHPTRWYDRLGKIREEPWFNRAYQQVATIEESEDFPLIIYERINEAAIPAPD
jgi:hypothetical protein